MRHLLAACVVLIDSLIVHHPASSSRLGKVLYPLRTRLNLITGTLFQAAARPGLFKNPARRYPPETFEEVQVAGAPAKRSEFEYSVGKFDTSAGISIPGLAANLPR